MPNENVYCFEGQETVPSPQLIFYPEIILENIRKMKAMAGGAARLWPHIKTHKSKDVTAMLVSEGIRRFKCSSAAELDMAAAAGAEALVLAYPPVGPNIGRFLSVRRRYPDVRFYAIGDSREALEALGQSAAASGETVDVLLDIDMGQHRTGVSLQNAETVYETWSEIEGLRLCGLHCYDGHRHEGVLTERLAAAERETDAVKAVVSSLLAKGYEPDTVIMGGTPSFPCHLRLTDFYVSPGTCVIQDAGYRDAYPDLPFVPGAAVLTRVISRPAEDRFTVDLGTKAVASDPAGRRAVIDGMPYAEPVMHNEEHMVLRVPAEHTADIPPIGTVLFALPVHVCPTVILYPYAETAAGGKMTGRFDITARDRNI